MSDDMHIHKWYALNALCERTGHVWISDSASIWDGPRPLFVEARNGVTYRSGEYGRKERRAAWCLSQLIDRMTPSAHVNMSDEGIYTDQQKVAIRGACKDPICVITGGPGTGKTTIAALIADHHKSVIGLSPTGKGADRLSESLSVDCYTIDRAVSLANRNKLDVTIFDLIIIDEAGMLDTVRLDKLCTLLYCNKVTARIVLMGDPGQLPSVGPGRVLDELIAALPTYHLDIVHRYSDADIGLACDAAKSGHLYDAMTDYYSLLESPDRHGIEMAWNEYCRLRNKHGAYETRIITYHRQHAHLINERGKYHYPRKPPVVICANDYESMVYNGQCGYLDDGSIYLRNSRVAAWRVQWTYAYASTCHKAQGGQWGGVVVWIPSARYVSKEWMLTACSRAVSDLSVVVRDPATTERCLIDSKPASKRTSFLAGFIGGEIHGDF